MNPTLYLCWLVVIVGSLAGTAKATLSLGNQTFYSDLKQLKNIYERPGESRYRSTPELMDFYKKYGNELQWSPRELLWILRKLPI